MSLPETRAEAKATGAPRFDGGVLCKHGHTVRYTATDVCVQCQLERNRRYYKKHPHKQRARHLSLAYGMSLEEFDKLLNAQGGVCAICSDPFEGRGRTAKAPCVDHCHSNGNIRAILCSLCNRGLGYFQDNIQLMRSAILYLEQHRDTPCKT